MAQELCWEIPNDLRLELLARRMMAELRESGYLPE